MELLSVRQAATRLNLSQNTIRGLCRARRLRHERHGVRRGVIRIPDDAIEEYRKGVTVEAGREVKRPPRKKAAPLRRLSLD